MKISNKIIELESKASKYDLMRGRYIKYAQKLKEIRDNIDNLMKEIDPMLNVYEPGTRMKRHEFSTIVKELGEKIRQGTTLKTTTISTIYPDLKQSQVYSVAKKLKALKFVGVRSKGRIQELFLTSEEHELKGDADDIDE